MQSLQMLVHVYNSKKADQWFSVAGDC
jgi:hypothetical protein